MQATIFVLASDDLVRVATNIKISAGVRGVGVVMVYGLQKGIAIVALSCSIADVGRVRAIVIREPCSRQSPLEAATAAAPPSSAPRLA